MLGVIGASSRRIATKVESAGHWIEPTVAPTRPLFPRMVSATLPVLFTYGGWQLVTYIAPHVHEPQRTLPKAIVLGVLGVGVTYLLFNAAYVRVLGMGVTVIIAMAIVMLSSGQNRSRRKRQNHNCN